MNVGINKNKLIKNNPGLREANPPQPPTNDSTSWSNITTFMDWSLSKLLQASTMFVTTKAPRLVAQPQLFPVSRVLIQPRM